MSATERDEAARYPCCDDCRVVLTEDTSGPSCGSHDSCIDCAAYTTCRECRQVMREVNTERRAEADFDYSRGA